MVFEFVDMVYVVLCFLFSAIGNCGARQMSRSARGRYGVLQTNGSVRDRNSRRDVCNRSAHQSGDGYVTRDGWSHRYSVAGCSEPSSRDGGGRHCRDVLCSEESSGWIGGAREKDRLREPRRR